MADTRAGQEPLDDEPHPRPWNAAALAACGRRTPPMPDHLASKRVERMEVQRHSVVAVMPFEDGAQVVPHRWDGVVPTAPQLLLDLKDLAAQSLRVGAPFDPIVPFPG